MTNQIFVPSWEIEPRVAGIIKQLTYERAAKYTEFIERAYNSGSNLTFPTYWEYVKDVFIRRPFVGVKRYTRDELRGQLMLKRRVGEPFWLWTWPRTKSKLEESVRQVCWAVLQNPSAVFALEVSTANELTRLWADYNSRTTMTP